MASKVIPLLLFLPSLLHGVNAQTWIRAGYWYSGAELPVRDIDSSLFTHLLCAFVFPSSSTNKLSINSSDEHDFSTFTDIVKRRNPSIITLLSIYGGRESSPIFFSMISQASDRKSFIQSSIKTARLYGFHGLDLCCVSPSNVSDITNLGILLEEWRSAVNSESRNSSQSPLILTMAIHYLPTVGSVSFPVDLMQKNLDWVQVLAYDYHVPLREKFTWAHTALYDPVSRINTNFSIGEWISRGFPASRLVLGLSYHGYAWTLVNPNDNALGAPTSGPAVTKDGSMAYKFIKWFIQTYGYGAASMYNATYEVNYCTIGSTWIAFDDVEAIRAKVSYAKKKRLLGYCAWQVPNDDNWVLSQAAQGEDKGQRNMKHLLLIVLLPIAIVSLVLGCMMCYFRRKLFKLRGVIDTEKESVSEVQIETSAVENLNSNAPNLQVFSFFDIKAATNNFSSENKLGEGGFGPVYKGKLRRVPEIAVKRLSKTSNQGLQEFRNEVTLTAKLQHVNLLRVLGFCTERKEKMLIYEYMQNKSLDCYLFDNVT